LKKLNSLAGTEVSFESRSKMTTKKIYSAGARQIDGNNFTLTVVADGGLMIKQFVGGEEYMKPNISEILGSKCECVTFDILDVV
jgi:tRNA pseudouridine synthase 10